MYRNRNRNRPKAPREPEEPDTTDPIGFTKNEHAGTKVYLVKMPNYLMEKFTAPVEPGKPAAVVGRLRIPSEASLKYDPNRPLAPGEKPIPKSESARIFVDSQTPGKRPETFELIFQDKDPKTYVFSEDKSAQAPNPAVEGTVLHTATARPAMDAMYRSINRARTQKANTKTRKTLLLSDSGRRTADNRALKPNALIETAKQREERKKSKEMARKHLDVPDAQWRELAKVAIFKAFEGGAHYSAEQIANDIDEPLSRLRHVLNEVCVYNKSGAFAGKYELKDEFKTVKQRMQKERELEEYRANQIENAKRKQEERAERERPSKRSKN